MHVRHLFLRLAHGKGVGQMGGGEWLTQEEKKQAGVFKLYLRRQLSFREARERSGLAESTFWRRLKRYREGGALGLRHRLRGRPSNREKRGVRARVLLEWDVLHPWLRPTARAFYRDWARPSWKVAYSTMRRWLRESGRLESPFFPRPRRLPSLIPRRLHAKQPPARLSRPGRQLSRRLREEKKLKRAYREKYEVMSPRLRRLHVQYLQRCTVLPPWKWFQPKPLWAQLDEDFLEVRPWLGRKMPARG